MKDVEIYTGMMCAFCHRAKALLNAKGIPYKEMDVSMNPSLRAEMIGRSSGRTSVPQIFIGGKHVGGCDDLYAIEARGVLDDMLAD